jgi:hypothetical protein
MLNEQEVMKALHASRVVSLPDGNYHGPLGLQRLAGCVAKIMISPNATAAQMDATDSSSEVALGT